MQNTISGQPNLLFIIFSMNFDQREFKERLVGWLSKKYLLFNFFDDEETESLFSIFMKKRKILYGIK